MIKRELNVCRMCSIQANDCFLVSKPALCLGSCLVIASQDVNKDKGVTETTINKTLVDENVLAGVKLVFGPNAVEFRSFYFRPLAVRTTVIF